MNKLHNKLLEISQELCLSSMNNEIKPRLAIKLNKKISEAINFIPCCIESPTNSEMNAEINEITERYDKMYTSAIYGSVGEARDQKECDFERLIYLVKNLTIPVVSNRRETLEKFADDWNNSKLKKELIFERDIDSHLKGETF